MRMRMRIRLRAKPPLMDGVISHYRVLLFVVVSDSNSYITILDRGKVVVNIKREKQTVEFQMCIYF